MITAAHVADQIAIVAPTLPESTRDSYAAMILTESRCSSDGRRCEINPSYIVSFVWHESDFRAGAVGDHGKAIGLGQSHWWLYTKECAGDADPVGSPSPACLAQRDRLFSPSVAFHTIATEIREARKTCRIKIHEAQFPQWLSLMGGRNDPSPEFRGVWCSKVGHVRANHSSISWTQESWQTLPKYKAIREIVHCQQSLTRLRPCARESPSDGESKPAARRTRTRSTLRRSTKS